MAGDLLYLWRTEVGRLAKVATVHAAVHRLILA